MTGHELRFGQGAGTRWAYCSADGCPWVMPAPGTGTARFQVEHNRHHHQEKSVMPSKWQHFRRTADQLRHLLDNDEADWATLLRDRLYELHNHRPTQEARP